MAVKSTAIAQESPGSAIDRLIEERGLRKNWVAAQLQITPSHLSRLISGERPVTQAMAERLATLFGVRPDLFGGAA